MSGVGRLKELLRKYGMVALGVHFTVSAASIAGLYVVIENNVEVQSVFERLGLPGLSKGGDTAPSPSPSGSTQPNVEITTGTGGGEAVEMKKERNRTAELLASGGGALTLALLLNKVLIPVRVPITFALTPPVARFLRARKIIKNAV